MNCGYWLIGKHDGQWVTYVSLDSLATMGYTIGEWHQIRTKIDEDGTGRFILISLMNTCLLEPNISIKENML